jgi:hypothetical protein
MGFARLTTLLPTPTPKTFDNCRKLTFLSLGERIPTRAEGCEDVLLPTFLQIHLGIFPLLRVGGTN